MGSQVAFEGWTNGLVRGSSLTLPAWPWIERPSEGSGSMHFLRVLLAGCDAIHPVHAPWPIPPHPLSGWTAGCEASGPGSRTHRRGRRNACTSLPVPSSDTSGLAVQIRDCGLPDHPRAGHVARSTPERRDSTNLARTGAVTCLGHQSAVGRARPGRARPGQGVTTKRPIASAIRRETHASFGETQLPPRDLGSLRFEERT